MERGRQLVHRQIQHTSLEPPNSRSGRDKLPKTVPTQKIMPSRLKSSLSLTEIEDVAPAEELSTSLRAEVTAGASDNENDGSEDQRDNFGDLGKREHYTKVMCSLRRRRANITEEQGGLLDSRKYKGQTSKWAEMNQEDSELKSHDSSNEDASADEDAPSEDHSSKASDSRESGSQLASENTEDAVSDSGQSDPSDIEGRLFSKEAAEEKRKPVEFQINAKLDARAVVEDSFQPPKSLASALASQQRLVDSLRIQAHQDATRGTAVKVQLSLWQRVLENRIRLEKVIGGRGLGRIAPSSYRKLLNVSQAEISPSAAQAVQDHLSLLDSIQQQSKSLLQVLLELLRGTGLCSDGLQAEIAAIGGKRRRSQTDEGGGDLDEDELGANHLKQLSACLQFGREVLQPFASSVFERHASDSTSFASTAIEADSNKFEKGAQADTLRALNQSINEKVEAAMSSEKARMLIDRTRKFRGDANDRIGMSFVADGLGGKNFDEQDESGQQRAALRTECVVDPETFDDSDFYSSLLRSLIDSSTLCIRGSAINSDGAPRSLFPSRTNTKSRGIDTRASKGRKLRFEVIEKVANFMPCIKDRERWTAEMKERLFNILPGRIATADRADDYSDSEQEQSAAQTMEMGGLQLFA